MSIRTIASLIAVSLALAGCKDLNAGLNILEGKDPDTVPAALAAFDEPDAPPAEEGIDYLLDWGRTPEGAYYATGWNCTNVPGLRICAGNMRKPGT